MNANATTEPTPAEADWTPYPEYGTDADILARMHLLMWIDDQLGPGKIEVNPGDYVLATDGRILGVGPDSDELDRRVFGTEPELRNARVVGCRVPDFDR